jgi:hypothetical protein
VTIAYRSSTSVPASGGGTVVVNKPAGVVQGDLLIAYIGWNNSGGTTITGVPDGWTPIDSFTNGTDLGVAFYWLIAGPAEPSSYVWTLSTSDTRGVIMEAFSGNFSGNPIAAHSIVRSTSGSVAITAVTVPAGGWFLAYFGDFNLGATFSTPPGLTARVVDGNQAAFDSGGPDPGSIAATTVIASSSGRSYGEALAIAETATPSRDIDLYVGRVQSGWTVDVPGSGWMTGALASGWTLDRPGQ